jgi:aspartyl-tRNA(Asn)/glutamyl-tRNA(Gln) amidotransferase subunit A
MSGSAAICSMDAVSLAALIKNRELSPVEVVDAALDRISRLDPTLLAFCTLTPDLAWAEARRLESQLMAGDQPGLLAGIPIGHLCNLPRLRGRLQRV